MASYNQRVVAEGDALAEEVSNFPLLCMLSICLWQHGAASAFSGVSLPPTLHA